MADIVEISRNLEGRSACFPVSASALCFHVRSNDNARLRFLSKPSLNESSFEITLGKDGNTKTRIDGNNFSMKSGGVTKETPNIISQDEWREFWVTWHRGSIRLGRGGNTVPFMEVRADKLNGVKWVSPATNTSQWKLLLGPMKPESKHHAVEGGEPMWVPADVSLPLGAVIGGHENEPLYVIRAPHEGSLTPGKFVPSEGTAYISWGGEAHPKEEFEVLVGYNFEWIPAKKDNIPLNAVPAGHAEYANRETLYVGRGEIDGHLIVGKVQRSHGVLYFPYQGKEVSRTHYEILVASSAADPRASRLDQRLLHRLVGTALSSVEDIVTQGLYEDEDDYYDEE